MIQETHRTRKKDRTIGRAPGGFAWKLILIAGSLLILSQALGTFISLITFESVLLDTLTAKYDILGKDVTRKIERSLKFGKRIDRFVGLEAICQPLFRQAGDIDEILVTDDRGKILFAARRPLSGETAARSEDRLPFQPTGLFFQQGTVSAMQLDGEKYYFLTQIEPDYSGQKGVLALVVSRAVLDRASTGLIQETAGTLGISLLLTLIVMVTGIRTFVTRPSRKQTDALVRQFKSRGDVFPRNAPTGGDETRHVFSRMLAFRHAARQAEQDLKSALDARQRPADRERRSAAVWEIQKLLEGNSHEKQ